MNDIVRYDDTTLPAKMEWARTMATASLLPRQYRENPGNLLFAVEYADALGVNRMAAITSIHVIEGRPSASSDLIANLVRKAGHRLRVTGDDQKCTAQLIRSDDPDFVFEATWTIAKARTAGLLGKDVWKKYPGAMLRARATTEVARMGAPDALFGVIYTPEELGAETDVNGEVVHSVTRVGPAQPAGSRAGGADRMREAIAGAPAPREPQPTPPAADAQAQPEETGPAMVTSAQLKKLGAGMREAGITERQQALDYVTSVIGRAVSSRNELTKDEASRVIDRLEQHVGEPAEDIVDGEVVDDPASASTAQTPAGPDADQVWQQILTIAGQRGMALPDVEDDVRTFFGGMTSAEASAAELSGYLTDLQGRAA